MWQVRYTVEGVEKSQFFLTQREALARAREWAGMGYRPRTRRCKTDVWILDPETGSMVLIMQKLDIRDAARWSLSWARHNRACGAVLWPAERRMPDGWRVVRPG